MDTHVAREVDRRAAAHLFAEWAAAAKNTAIGRAARGDRFGAHLATERADVYLAASKIVGVVSAATAGLTVDDRTWLEAQGWRPEDNVGVVLMRHAMHSAVTPETGWTLRAWDTSGARYVRARAWQLCAWHLDPGLPEVQPEWS